MKGFCCIAYDATQGADLDLGITDARRFKQEEPVKPEDGGKTIKELPKTRPPRMTRQELKNRTCGIELTRSKLLRKRQS